MAEEGIESPIRVFKVETEEEAQRLRFIGSPTILVDGQDIQPPPDDAWYTLTCRAYYLENGRVSPLSSLEMIRRALTT